MKTMTATEASRGLSDLLDAVERGEVVTVTRGGHVVAEIRPAVRKTGRDLRLLLEAREARGEGLSDADAEEMLRYVEDNRAEVYPASGDEDPWADS